MDDAAWLGVSIALSAVGGVLTYLLYQRRGLPPALKMAGVSLLPVAAYLTDTLRMFTEIVSATLDWAAGLVFGPMVWLGIALTGLAVVLYSTGRALSARQSGQTKTVDSPRAPASARKPKEPRQVSGNPAEKPGSGGEGDDFADIERILKQRGIS